MTFREACLFAVLVALGTVTVKDQSERNRRRLGELRCRSASLAQDVRQLQECSRRLKSEAVALRTDRYYVERVARSELRWRPVDRGGDRLPVDTVPVFDSALALGVPGAAPGPPSPAGPPEPAPPAPPPQEDRGRRLLAALGYDSVEHFQIKMMPGKPSGALDATTCRRAEQLALMVRVLGFESVKAFQARHGLPTDGVFGRRSERRAAELLQAQRRDRRGAAAVVVQTGRQTAGPEG